MMSKRIVATLVVFFYGANSWSYTKIGKVEASSIEELESVLSGSETEVISSYL